MSISSNSKQEVRAKLFLNGRSQAVRLPKEFRFEGKEVKISHLNGGVMLEPVKEEQRALTSAAELFERLASYGGDAIFPEGREQPAFQERDWNAFNTTV